MEDPDAEIIDGSHDAAPFDLSGGHPALDLVNTRDFRFREDGGIELLQSYGDLLRFMRQAALLSESEAQLLSNTGKKGRALRSALELREGLAATFYGALDGSLPPPAAVRTLQQQFQNAARHRVLQWRQGRLEWTWEETSAELPVWILAQAASELMTSEAMARVRACNAETCRWLFLDTSKNRTRRWCNMKVCGNRMKARKFRAGREE